MRLPTSHPQRLNCIQIATGDQLSIPTNKVFRKGEAHCVRLSNGQQASFGLNWSNQFGLFVNGETLWAAPATSVSPSHWIFQSDGNMLMRDSNNQAIWRTQTDGNSNSKMKLSFGRVWIESNTGSTLWSQPNNIGLPKTPAPTSPNPTPPPTRLLNCVQTVTGVQLTITMNTLFRKGEVHCLRLSNGRQAYFGHASSNKFGLFIDDQSVWTAPNLPSLDQWIFQGDGNLVLIDGNNTPIWATGSDGNFNSRLRVSSDRVWIEGNTGGTLWSSSQPPTSLNLNCVQTATGVQLTIPKDTLFRKGEVHCLRLSNGQHVYFGYTSFSKFGLFVDDRSVWTAPNLPPLNGWIFQGDGNLVLQDGNNGPIWATGTGGNFKSQLRVYGSSGIQAVWIEGNTGGTVWSSTP